VSAGRIRIRSNVADAPNRWDLVPGEILDRVDKFRVHSPTRRQHDERMYYAPCSKCERTIASIMLTGCPQTPPCREAPSAHVVDGALDAWCERVDAARELEARENSQIASLGSIILDAAAGVRPLHLTRAAVMAVREGELT
jgi:hypothetical protein